ncbi:MAG: nucleotidyltransferase family protein [Actinomycetota bacterium]
MAIHPEIEFDREALDAFCSRNSIRRLSMFGSALGDGSGSESDIDLLVEFEPEHVPGLIRLAGMELELAKIFRGREIELRTY